MSTEPNDCLADAFYDLIISLHQSILNPVDEFKKLHIPPSQIKVIFYLKRNGPVPISQAARDLEISRPNMTPIIDKLIGEGMVRRYDDPNDRRITLVEIDAKGETLYNHGIASIKQGIADKVVRLSAADQAELGRLVVKMETIIKKLT